MKFFKALFVFCLIIVLISGLSARNALSGEVEKLTVAVASNIAFALKEIAAQFEKDTGVRIILSFGSTGKLFQQISYGAPFDVFFAADEKYIDELNDKGLIISDSRTLYARGMIVLAVNKHSGVEAKKLKDLLSPEIKRVAIANPDHAPYGIAAKEALLSAGLWEGLKGKLVYGENIRQALQFIETGNAQAGIVALSVADVSGITYTKIDPTLHKPINQAAAVIKETKNPDTAREFIQYVNGPKGRPIMEKYGFLIPSNF